MNELSAAAMADAIPPVEESAREVALERFNALAKPPHSLGFLENVVGQLAAIQGRSDPSAGRAALWLFAGDHGLARDGVTAWPQSVTAAMLATFAAEGAAINQLCRANDIRFAAVDAGVTEPPAGGGYRDLAVGRGTASSLRGPAMSEATALEAMHRGFQLLREADGDAELVGLGEMGIGNSASASLVTHALTGVLLEDCIGRGAGLDDAGLSRKRRLLARVIDRHGRPAEPLAVLARFGGYEMAMMAGAVLGAAANRQAVLVDGFIATAAAALACAMAPSARPYCLFCHASAEPGHRHLLDHLAGRALLDLDMALGEGSGCALAVPLIRSAVACHQGMDTIETVLARHEAAREEKPA